MTMSTRTDGKIRPIVWLMGLTPFVLVAGVFVYLLQPDKKPAPRPAAAAPASLEPQTPAAMISQVAPLSPPPQPVALPTAIASAALLSAAPSGATSERAEIDALLLRPPGSDQWTAEQKTAYRAQLSRDLRARERKLEWEIAAAHRSRDSATEQAKTETLAHLRQAREVLEGPLPAPSGLALPTDAGLAD